MFRVGSHVDRTEFQVVSVDKQSCAKYLDIGNGLKITLLFDDC